MQIVDYIPHSRFKITVFKSGVRYIVKFDDADHDLAIKFRQGEVNNLLDVKNQVDEDLLERVAKIFSGLSSFRATRFSDSQEERFDII